MLAKRCGYVVLLSSAVTLLSAQSALSQSIFDSLKQQFGGQFGTAINQAINKVKGKLPIPGQTPAGAPQPAGDGQYPTSAPNGEYSTSGSAGAPAAAPTGEYSTASPGAGAGQYPTSAPNGEYSTASPNGGSAGGGSSELQYATPPAQQEYSTNTNPGDTGRHQPSYQQVDAGGAGTPGGELQYAAPPAEAEYSTDSHPSMSNTGKHMQPNYPVDSGGGYAVGSSPSLEELKQQAKSTPDPNALRIPSQCPFTMYAGGRLTESYWDNQGGHFQFNTVEPVKKMSDYYLAQLRSKGWYINSPGMETPNNSSIHSAKNGQETNVFIHYDSRIGMTVVRLVLLYRAP